MFGDNLWVVIGGNKNVVFKFNDIVGFGEGIVKVIVM